MCGFVAVLTKQLDYPIEKLRVASKAISHRGPDDSGYWHEDGVHLAHVRLSIHDLSQAGHQPMISNSGNLVIIFNGEIYNYQSIKEELKLLNVKFVSNSDTEVLVNAIEQWGIDKTLKKLTGMFAFACWDRQQKLLYLARDRFGEKPLYYGFLNGDFVFSSELKPLHVNYKNCLKINQKALGEFMRLGYVPTPYSIYENIDKLFPASYAIVNYAYDSVTIHKYWDVHSIINEQEDFTGSYQDAKELLKEKLIASVNAQMCADTPVGAFLSGGVDSSTISAIMQSVSTNKVNTFSIGFYDRAYNEAEHAKQVANVIGSNHTEIYVSEKEALDVIPKLSTIFDEPFADSSQIPTFLVSALAAKNVTVSLTGDGADEIFGGYTRHWQVQLLHNKFLEHKIPRSLLRCFPSNLLTKLNKIIGSENIGNKSHIIARLNAIFKQKNIDAQKIYLGLCSQLLNPSKLVRGTTNDSIILSKDLLHESFSINENVMLWDAMTYMMDDILVKVDRAAMAVSLETRAPFLDHSLFEFAWSLPLNFKLDGKTGKKILKDVLYDFVPKQIVDRPKMGFSVPLSKWLKGDLLDLVHTFLSKDAITSHGYLEYTEVQRYWDSFYRGNQKNEFIIWNILMFQMWLSHWHQSI